MKKTIITALMILSIITYSVIPFSVVNASTSFTEYSGSDFDYGHYTVYYFENPNGYVIADMFDFINVPQQFESCIVNEISFDNYYDGSITMNFAGNITTNLWQCYLEGDGAYITNLTSTNVTIQLVHCQKFYLYGFCNNNADMNLRPKTSNPFEYPKNNLTPYTDGSEELLNYNRSIISTFEYHENYNYTDSTHLDYIYNSNNLNSNSYTYKTSSNRGVKRVNTTFEINNYTGGNYYVFNFYIMSNSILNENSFNNLTIRTRDEASSRIYNILYYKYQEYYKFEGQNQSIINLVLYVPIYSLSVYRGNSFQLDFLNFDVNVRVVKFAYLGMVETLPDETNVINPSTDIDDTTDQIIDLQDQESQIVSGFQDDLTDFNTNMDLSDYDFITGFQNSNNYFKMLLDNMYVNSSSVRAFWIIPVILVLFLAITGRK